VLRAIALTVYAFPVGVKAGSPSDLQYSAIAKNAIRSTGSESSGLYLYLIEGRIVPL
jgi:hypothetical protein